MVESETKTQRKTKLIPIFAGRNKNFIEITWAKKSWWRRLRTETCVLSLDISQKPTWIFIKTLKLMTMSKLIYIDVSKHNKDRIYPQFLFKQKKKLYKNLSKTLLFKTEGFEWHFSWLWVSKDLHSLQVLWTKAYPETSFWGWSGLKYSLWHQKDIRKLQHSKVFSVLISI